MNNKVVIDRFQLVDWQSIKVLLIQKVRFFRAEDIHLCHNQILKIAKL